MKNGKDKSNCKMMLIFSFNSNRKLCASFRDQCGTSFVSQTIVILCQFIDFANVYGIYWYRKERLANLICRVFHGLFVMLEFSFHVSCNCLPQRLNFNSFFLQPPQERTTNRHSLNKSNRLEFRKSKPIDIGYTQCIVCVCYRK